MNPEGRIIVLGSTGSIGVNTLEVVSHMATIGRSHRVIGLAAGRNASLLQAQASVYQPEVVALADEAAAAGWSGHGTCLCGPDAARQLVERVARPGDMIVAAIVGAAGLEAVLEGIHRGCDIALANKETLVAAGSLVMPAVEAAGVSLIPVDSEHSAIFQCLHGLGRGAVEIKRIVLTASGGAFRGRSRSDIVDATVDEALAHPTWSMGRKITIDSATLANKALEVIEAHWLFGLEADRIDAIVHPQSMVHGFVEFQDGSVLAQAGPPDMKTPIQYALTWPDRVEGCARTLDWSTLREMTFDAIDHHAFPMISLGWDVIRRGGTAGATFNAANEAAVELFLCGDIRFGGISDLVTAACAELPVSDVQDLNDVRVADKAARAWIHSHVSTVAEA